MTIQNGSRVRVIAIRAIPRATAKALVDLDPERGRGVVTAFQAGFPENAAEAGIMVGGVYLVVAVWTNDNFVEFGNGFRLPIDCVEEVGEE